MLSVSFLTNDPAWKTLLAKERAYFRQALKKTFSYLNMPPKKFNVSVVFTGDDDIRNLNKEYRGKNKPTNVLSFPQFEDLNDILAANDNDFELGDIVLAFETIKNEASAQKKTMKNHTTHLLVHGLLHLCGFDHLTEQDANDMEAMEIAILESLKIKNPYA